MFFLFKRESVQAEKWSPQPSGAATCIPGECDTQTLPPAFRPSPTPGSLPPSPVYLQAACPHHPSTGSLLFSGSSPGSWARLPTLCHLGPTWVLASSPASSQPSILLPLGDPRLLTCPDNPTFFHPSMPLHLCFRSGSSFTLLDLGPSYLCCSSQLMRHASITASPAPGPSTQPSSYRFQVT